MKRWYIAYHPFHSSQPSSRILSGDIETLIRHIHSHHGTVIFFAELPAK